MKSPIIVMDIDGLYNAFVPRREILAGFNLFREIGYQIYLVADRPKVAMGQATLEEISEEVNWFMSDCFDIPTEIVFNITHPEGTVFPFGGTSLLQRPAPGLLMLLEQVAVHNHGHVIDWADSFIIYNRLDERFSFSLIKPTEVFIEEWIRAFIDKDGDPKKVKDYFKSR